MTTTIIKEIILVKKRRKFEYIYRSLENAKINFAEKYRLY